MIRVCVAGCTGWTGSAVADAVEAADDLQLVAGVSRSDVDSFTSVAEALDAVRADVLVDYTHAAVVKQNVVAAIERGVAVVVGSSGMSAADYDEIDAEARANDVGVVAAGNFSLTAALLLRFSVEAARHLDTWEVIDYASAGKQDAPSGTSREVAERLDAVRAPAIRFRSTKYTASARPAERPSRAHKFTRSGCRASRSRPRQSSAPRASGSRFATTRARVRPPTLPGRSLRSAPSQDGSDSRAGSTSCSAEPLGSRVPTRS